MVPPWYVSHSSFIFPVNRNSTGVLGSILSSTRDTTIESVSKY